MMGGTGHVIRAIAATGAILAAESLPDTSADWVQMVERLGLAVALVVFFVATGWMREKRMATRIDFLEKSLTAANKTVSALTERVNTSLDSENHAMEKMGETMLQMARVIEGRTCVAFENHEEFRQFQEWRRGSKKDTETTPFRGIVQQG